MIDDRAALNPFDGTRSLLHDIIRQLDMRVARYLKDTPFAKVRMSDVKVFVAAARKPRSIAQIARDHGVSRQAIQSSVHRLLALEVVALQFSPDNHRDKIVVVSDVGHTARNKALEVMGLLENECSEIIGAKGMEQFRAQLLALTTTLKARQLAGDFGELIDEDEVDADA